MQKRKIYEASLKVRKTKENCGISVFRDFLFRAGNIKETENFGENRKIRKKTENSIK